MRTKLHGLRARALAAAITIACAPACGGGEEDGGGPPPVRPDAAAGDTTAPRTTIVSGPTDPTSSTLAVIELACSEEDCNFSCALDGAPPEPCTSPVRYRDLAEGQHRVSIVATDAAGNVESPGVEVVWRVDVTPPETIVDAAPPATTTATAATFEFHCDEPPCNFTCELDHGVYRRCASPHSVTVTSTGAHVMIIKAEDLAGNRDDSAAQIDWTVLPR